MVVVVVWGVVCIPNDQHGDGVISIDMSSFEGDAFVRSIQ